MTANPPKSTRPRNRLETATLNACVTPGIYALVLKLTDTHFFGRTEHETAAMILSAEVKRLQTSGELDNLVAKAPVTVPKTSDAQNEDAAP
jgi:hypothetical protein